MLTTLAILGATIAVALLLVWPRVATNRLWRATTTPLASIIGSGFLVLGPLLDDSFGRLAPLVMAGLCALAFAFGAAVRVNIRAIDQGRGRAEGKIEPLASWILAVAYVISVAYYLNLFGAFALSLLGITDGAGPKIVTTAVYLVILIVGLGKGFHALERMEQVSVGLKLAVIAGLIAGLAAYFGGIFAAGTIARNPTVVTGWPALTLAFGLVVTVQGFETSRYLGASYDAGTRVRSMVFAQALSTLIYLVYVTLLAFSFPSGTVPFSETAIIGMMALVAPVLPPLLVLAALSAQFSAAVADTGGSGGLVAELTRGRIGERPAYALLVTLGLVMTWGADVFAIIALASRAFAAYYGLQSVMASVACARKGRWFGAAGFAGLAVLGFTMAVFGRSVEG